MTKYAMRLALVIAFATPAFAQHSHKQGHQPQHNHGPYSSFQNREIKALSQQQIDDLKSGKGMSLALPAELNGYPGPAHSLELADPLKLTQRLFSAMSNEAKKLGLEVIEAERNLDALFKNKTVNPQNLRDATLKAGEAQARLRESHLRYHLLTIEVLSTEQIASYNRLRGY